MTTNAPSASQRSALPFVSVVLPVFNEQKAIEQLVEQILKATQDEVGQLEILFVNDGSTDQSGEVLDRVAEQDPEVRVLHLSRNFGHQAAVQAGLEHAQGQAIIVMDSDLQDNPAVLPEFLNAWKQGSDIIYAKRTQRKESVWKRALFKLFYRLLNRVTSVQIPKDAGNFSLLDRRVLDHLNQLPECDRYFPGLRSWVGFKQSGIEVERLSRYDEKPRVSLLGLFRLAKTAIFSFSNVPLTMFYVVGGLSFLLSSLLAGFALYHKYVTGLALPGWTSTTMIVSLFGAINSLGIAVLGEYAARIYDQVRTRPHYLVARQSGRVSQGDGIPSKGQLQEIPEGSPELEILNWIASNRDFSPKEPASHQ